jgi:hypothetical protein
MKPETFQALVYASFVILRLYKTRFELRSQICSLLVYGLILW